jgi:hypothetical protein
MPNAVRRPPRDAPKWSAGSNQYPDNESRNVIVMTIA